MPTGADLEHVSDPEEVEYRTDSSALLKMGRFGAFATDIIFFKTFLIPCGG